MERAIGLLAAVCAVLALFPALCKRAGFDLIRPPCGGTFPCLGEGARHAHPLQNALSTHKGRAPTGGDAAFSV